MYKGKTQIPIVAGLDLMKDKMNTLVTIRRNLFQIVQNQEQNLQK